MDSKKVHQENLCLITRDTIDLLRMELYELQSESEFKKSNVFLKELKRNIYKKYFSI